MIIVINAKMGIDFFQNKVKVLVKNARIIVKDVMLLIVWNVILIMFIILANNHVSYVQLTVNNV